MARHNLSTVIGFEFRRTITKRRFWAITLIVPILVFGLGGLIIASNVSTANTADQQKNARFEFCYTDASGLVDPAIAKQYGGTEIASRRGGRRGGADRRHAGVLRLPGRPGQADGEGLRRGPGHLPERQVLRGRRVAAVRPASSRSSTTRSTVAVLRGDVNTATTTFATARSRPDSRRSCPPCSSWPRSSS